MSRRATRQVTRDVEVQEFACAKCGADLGYRERKGTDGQLETPFIHLRPELWAPRADGSIATSQVAREEGLAVCIGCIVRWIGAGELGDRWPQFVFESKGVGAIRRRRTSTGAAKGPDSAIDTGVGDDA